MNNSRNVQYIVSDLYFFQRQLTIFYIFLQIRSPRGEMINIQTKL